MEILRILQVKQTNMFRRNILKYCARVSSQQCSTHILRTITTSTRRSKKMEEDVVMSKIRNIGIMAHIDAGKTTTTERMLYYSGFTRRLGDVDDGDTVMDWMEQERERGITITSAAITFHWAGHKINLIDTPGHVDFTVEVERSLRVLDGAVAILDASAGVEAQTLTVWRQADNYNIPRLVFLNKMDKPGASLELCLKSMEAKLHVTPLVLNLPIGSGKDFQGIQDLITLEEITWDKASRDGSSYNSKSINLDASDETSQKVLQARTELIGQLADLDDNIADLVLSDTDIKDFPAKDIISAIRTATLEQKVLPVLCGSSLKNKGIQSLLDAIGFYLPSPMDVNYGFAKYYGSNLCALAFKVQFDKRRGPLTFLRLYSGILKSGASVFNINRNQSEKTSRILQVYSDDLEDIQSAVAGNIVAVAGLKQTWTGDTITSSSSSAKQAAQAYQEEVAHQGEQLLSDEELEEGEDVDMSSREHLTSSLVPVLAGMSVPQPVFFCSVEANSQSTQKALDAALENLQKEDPSLKVEVNSDTGQTVLSGMGELHLDIIRSRLQKEYRLDVDLGPLEIAYRETILDSGQGSEVIDQSLAGKHQFVDISLSIHPSPDQQEFKQVILKPIDQDNPLDLKHWVLRAINNGVKSALSHGSLLNFPVINCEVHLHQFSKKFSTSVPMMTAAASMATSQALSQATCVMLEPTMAMEITVDEDYVDPVLSDLGRRRSHILNMASRHDARVISTLTPLSELVGYSTEIRTLTSGTASVSMQLSHYERMSQDQTQAVIDRLSGFYSAYR